MEAYPVYHDGQVYVRKEQCETCIFRPGNLMHLESGRVAEMVREAKQGESVIPCHHTIYGETDQEAVCRGYWDRYRNDVFTLRLAQMKDMIVEI